MVKNRKKWKFFVFVCAGFLIGVFLVAYPQMYVNNTYLGSYSPKVPTENYHDGDLKNWQIAQGLTVDRYETFAGVDTAHDPGMRFDDMTGETITKNEALQSGVNFRQLIHLIRKYPMDIMGIYVRHLVNYLTIIWKHCYIFDLHISILGVLIPNILLWLVFFYSLFSYRWSQYKRWIINEAWMVLPLLVVCIFMVPGAVELRFFISGYALMYGFMCYRIDFDSVRCTFVKHPIIAMCISVTVLLLWISVIGQTLSDNTVGIVLFNNK